MAKTQLLDLVCKTLNDYLVQTLQTDMAQDDPARAVLVRVGRLQEDPTEQSIYVLTNSGDPDDPEGWAHNQASMGANYQPGMSFDNPPYVEIGGTESFWWRRMTVNVGCFLLTGGYTRIQAQEIAHEVYGRVEQAIQACPGIKGLKDDFNEKILALYIAKSNFTEGGGPPDSFIWRGKIYFTLMTTR